MFEFFGWIIGVVFKLFFAVLTLVITNIPSWVWYGIAALVMWRIWAYFWKQHQTEKFEEAARVKKREEEKLLNSIQANIEEARKIQLEQLIGLCSEYDAAINSGDIFIATAKGRRYYALNRIYEQKDTPRQAVDDEVTIKNEVLKRKIRPAL